MKSELTPAMDPQLHGARREFLRRLALIHAEAHALGLHYTGHILHDAVKRSGWEQAQLEAKLGEEP